MSGARKTKPKALIAAVKPVNLVSERKKWMADQRYEPQFRYADPEAAAAACRQHPARDDYMLLALSVLERVRERYGSESQYHHAVWGKVLTKAQADEAVQAYLQRHGLASLVRVRWSPAHLVTSFGGGCLRLVDRAGYYREQRLQGLLDHEVGTHFVRDHNGRIYGRSKKCRSSSASEALATEEGLASLNTHQFMSDKSLFQPALLYWACCRARSVPFSQLSAEMARYVDDPDRRWVECVRVKRGLVDCGSAGGLGKDQAAWDGLVRLLYFRRSPILNFRTLHCAKVSLEEYDDAAPQLEGSPAPSSLMLPHFLSDLEAYLERLDKTAADNGLSHWLAPSGTPVSHRPLYQSATVSHPCEPSPTASPSPCAHAGGLDGQGSWLESCSEASYSRGHAGARCQARGLKTVAGSQPQQFSLGARAGQTGQASICEEKLGEDMEEGAAEVDDGEKSKLWVDRDRSKQEQMGC